MIVALFAKSFGWSVEYILSLTPSQIAYLQDGLGEIARCESGEKEKERQFTIDKKLSEMGLDRIIENKKRAGMINEDGSVRFSANDIGLAGRKKE